MEHIIDFFLRNKGQLVEFMKSVHVNREKTRIKFGYIEDEGLNIAFFINNEPDDSINAYEEKIKCLFNSDIEDIVDLINQLKPEKACTIHCVPYLKINDSPVIHAFQMNINYKV